MNFNTTRTTQLFLQKFQKKPPSFTIHLYHEHWFLNNAKFLYSNQCSAILEDIRAFRIPVDFLELFEQAHVPYYDGRLIVELLDYRSPSRGKTHVEKPYSHRVVLQPNGETIWADVLSLNATNEKKWTDRGLLEIEAAIINATGPPLCLDPDPNLCRIVNTIIRTTSPGILPSLKRKQSADLEEEENERIKRTKIMQFMDPRAGKPNTARVLKLAPFFGEAKKNFKYTPPVPTPAGGPQAPQPQMQIPTQTQPNLLQQPQTTLQTEQQPEEQVAQQVPQVTTPQQQPVPSLAAVTTQEEAKRALGRAPGKKKPDADAAPSPTTSVAKGKKKPLINTNASPAGTPRGSAEQSPATSLQPTPQRISLMLPAQQEDVKPVVGNPNSNANQQPQHQPGAPPFTPQLPHREFLQQPPQGPRRKSNAAVTQQSAASVQQLQQQLSQLQYHAGTPPQLPQIPQDQMIAMAKANPAMAKQVAQRYGLLGLNAQLAQNIPARSSPLANPSQTVAGPSRASPHIAAQQVQPLARNSPLLAAQQLAPHRNSPLATGDHASPGRSPLPGNPMLPTLPQQQQQVAQQQQIPIHQQQQMATQQQQQHMMPQPHNGQGSMMPMPTAAQQLNPQFAQNLANQRNAAQRTATPLQQQQQMQRAQLAQQQMQQQQMQQQQQQMPPSLVNTPYHPANLQQQYAQMQHMQQYSNPAWRAAAAQGRVGPQAIQQQQQLLQQQYMAAAANNGQIPNGAQPTQQQIMMANRAAAARRLPPGR